MAAGICGLVVVAKHHDGFCLWPTKTTPHNIAPDRHGRLDDEDVRSRYWVDPALLKLANEATTERIVRTKEELRCLSGENQ